MKPAQTRTPSRRGCTSPTGPTEQTPARSQTRYIALCVTIHTHPAKHDTENEEEQDEHILAPQILIYMTDKIPVVCVLGLGVHALLRQ